MCWHVLVFGYHFLPPRYKEHDPVVMFFMSRVSLCSLSLPPPSTTFYHPNMKDASCDPVVLSFMSGWSLCPSHHLSPPSPFPLSWTPDTTGVSPHGLVLVFGHVPSSCPYFKHHNVPVWTCSDAQAPHLSLTSLPVFALICKGYCGRAGRGTGRGSKED